MLDLTEIFEKIRNGLDSFIEIEQTVMLIGAVNGVAIQTKAH
jgi:hypothetical protein